MPNLTGIRQVSLPPLHSGYLMTRSARLFITSLIAVAAVLLGMSETAAAEPIENRASLSLQLGGTRQTY